MLTGTCRYVLIRSYTPSGKGLATRSPMIPYAAEQRGKRIPGTRFYKVSEVQPADEVNKGLSMNSVFRAVEQGLRDAKVKRLFRKY